MELTFIKMGDFCEAIGDIAKPVSEALGIVLTKSVMNVPFCGVPYHRWTQDKATLEAMGHTVMLRDRSGNVID